MPFVNQAEYLCTILDWAEYVCTIHTKLNFFYRSCTFLHCRISSQCDRFSKCSGGPFTHDKYMKQHQKQGCYVHTWYPSFWYWWNRIFSTVRTSLHHRTRRYISSNIHCTCVALVLGWVKISTSLFHCRPILYSDASSLFKISFWRKQGWTVELGEMETEPFTCA